MMRWRIFVVLLLGMIHVGDARSATTATLDWVYDPGSAQIASTFLIERQDACQGGYVALREVPATTLTWRDTVQQGQTYCWRVTALLADDTAQVVSNVVRCIISNRNRFVCS